MVTSKGTLDKNDSAVRKNLAEQADLLGAVRLPADSFGKSANTAVTSDLLFFQKKAEPSIGEPIWTYTGLTEDMVPVNEYYLEHPEMMLGKMVWFEQFFGKDSNIQPWSMKRKTLTWKKEFWTQLESFRKTVMKKA